MKLNHTDVGINDKKHLRSLLLSKRNAVPISQRQERALAAAVLMGATELWQSAKTVALYIAKDDEFSTAPLLDKAWAEGKILMLPRCLKNSPGLMEFAQCRGADELHVGKYGIAEPSEWPGQKTFDAKKNNSSSDDSVLCPDCVIVPGVAFDRFGRRLGMGGGYYDRLLPTLADRAVSFVGYAYACQLVDVLPEEPWDIPVHYLCTEEEFFPVSQAKQ